MIFGRNLVTCDDFGVYCDEVTIAGVNFIGRKPICGHYLQGGVLLGTSHEDSNFRSSISSSIVTKTKSSIHGELRVKGDESAAFVITMIYTADVFSLFWMHFGLIS